MKTILGLDLGTNSIGWALTQQNFEKKEGIINGIGSRIIPMSQDILGKFDSGVSISQTAERTGYRGVRRLYQRDNLRRERLHRVLNILSFLPEHYANSIDFEKHFGQFKENTEVKLNYHKVEKEYQENEKIKYEFLFIDSFNEMVKEFEKNKQSIKIPYDWTLYYLRKKALSHKISKEELAWVILNFNQKRGYYQLRGEDEEDKPKLEEFYTLKVSKVEATEDKNTKGTWYNVTLENDWIYRRQSKESLDSWVGKSKEFIVTTTLEKDGTFKKDKEGNVKRSFRAPKEDDWNLLKKKTEQELEGYINNDFENKSVGTYIYETLLQNPTQKIRGKLVKTIERKFYKKEFRAIIKEQIKHHPELQSREMYDACVYELYPRSEAHQNNIKDKDFDYLFTDDIIFYQRPLKSKKSTISNCQYEYRKFKIDGIEQPKQYLKAISKSHPLFQEFRLWQFLKNFKIYQKEFIEDGKTKLDVDITVQLLKTENDWVGLFDFLNTRKEIEQHQILKYFSDLKLIPKQKKVDSTYRWNYVEEKKYPCNTTKAQFLSRLKKVKDLDVDAFLTSEKEYKLWHIIYSVTDINEFEKAIENFAKKNGLDKETFESNFKKFPPFKSDYGAYSEKAIKKLLPLMRRGKYWDENTISEEVKNRVTAIMERITNVNVEKDHKDFDNELTRLSDDDIPKRLLKSFFDFKDKNPLESLNTYQACYAVYNRHSEASSIKHWKHPQDITEYLDKFKQHSLRNPIVEQVVTETLRTVRDIWIHYAEKSNSPFIEKVNKKTGITEKHYERLFDKIHIELGREMKNPADVRESMSKRNTENENTNHRIKEILKELMNDSNVEGNVKPYSPSHQEILKIYEEGVYQNPNTEFSILSEDDIKKIRENKSPTKDKSSPTKADIQKYKLWLEQGYVSPYTGKPIPMSKLFTTDYQIEHIIPQSRYFNNSMSNKIICESEVNQLKDNQTAFEFIKKHGTEKIDLGQGKTVNIFTLEQYEKHCNQYFKKNRTKLKNLLSEDIPEGFINRQLNDSRYISKLVKGLLSNLVREENEQEATSKHIVPVTGSITSKLKQDWGLNDKWNELITPRFERLNKLVTKEGEALSTDFGYWDHQKDKDGKNLGKQFFRTQVPDEIAKGFNKKRIDHRHHALDALVIACCTKKHTNYLGALNTEKKNYGLRDSLLIKNKEGHYTKHFLIPWNNFTTDAKSVLEKMIISFKQNTRVINKTNNKTWQWVKKDGKFKKELVKQTKGDNWAIRKPMHKETVSGKLDIPAPKGKVVTATRVSLSEIKTQKHLEKITDESIQNILECHLQNYLDEKGKKQFDLAFSQESIEELNKNIVALNNGKNHQPIYKVRLYEVGSKFKVGYSGNKKDKYVESAKGTNLFFAIYWDEEKKKRVFDTIPLNEVIEHQKQVAHLPKKERTPVPINNTKGQFILSLSPNDLVYVPTDEEMNNSNLVDFKNLSKEQVSRVYKMVSCTGTECHFIPNSNASEIKKNENGTNSKNERIQNLKGTIVLDSDNKLTMIKNRCWKLKVNRLGNIQSVIIK